jgi:protease-4
MKDFLKFTFASILGVLIAGVLLVIILIGIVSSMLSVSEQPTQIDKNSVLIIRLDQEIVERSSSITRLRT